jgi:hypothetical protein
MKHAIIFSALCCAAMTAGATDIDFTYNVNDEYAKVYGFNKKEAYDVAIKIADPSYVGAKVLGLTVDFPVDTAAADGFSAWMSTELLLENKLNAPDICSQTATLEEDVLSVTFDQPYTIPADGVWVGYSFNITQLDNQYGWPGSPLAVIESEDNLDYGLWVHSSRSYLKWYNLANKVKAVSTMIVHLQTEFGPNDVAVGVAAESYMVAGEEYPVNVTLINHGTEQLNEITYTYSIGDFTGTGSYLLETPIEPLGKTGVVSLALGPVEECGSYPFSIAVDTSNGSENKDPMRSGSGNMNVWPVIPVTRPLVEEFTGLNCGYCPRGYVAMEEMSKMYGDRFVGMAYHSQSYESSMVTVLDRDFPIDVPGFPYADLNRRFEMDPSQLPYNWGDCAKEIVPMSVDVSAEWSDDDHSEIVGKSSVIFVKDFDTHNYELAFALVADGLQNPTWLQSNYYAGANKGDGVESDLWDLFLKGGSKVPGLVFNDVVAYFKDIRGIAGSLPEKIEAGEEYTFEYRIPMDQVLTIRDKEFLNNGCSLHMVAIVLDTQSGYSVNCNKSNSLTYTTSGVEGVEMDDAEVVSTVYTNLQGVRVANPSAGVYLKTVTLSDGTTRTEKITVK